MLLEAMGTLYDTYRKSRPDMRSGQENLFCDICHKMPGVGLDVRIQLMYYVQMNPMDMPLINFVVVLLQKLL